MTKAEAVKRLQLENEGTVDYAIPQSLVDDIREIVSDTLNEALGNPASHFVYLYPKKENGVSFGFPYPLTKQAVSALKALNRIKGASYRTDFPTIESLEAKDKMYEDAYGIFWNGASNPKGIINTMYEYFIGNDGLDTNQIRDNAALKLMVYQLQSLLTKDVETALQEVRDYLEIPVTASDRS